VGPDAPALQPYSVDHLIDQSTKDWNEQLVVQLLDEGTTQ